MASAETIATMLATTKAIYPYYLKNGDSASTAKTWNILLKDYPDDVVQASFMECLKTCKMPPTPADVIGNIKSLLKANMPSDEELWGKFVKSLRKAQDHLYYLQFPREREEHREAIEKLFNELPEQAKRYAGDIGEFKRMADLSDDELKYEKTRFLKNMPQMNESVEIKKAFASCQIEGEKYKNLLGG